MRSIRSRHSLMAWLFAIALSFALAACGGGDDGDDAEPQAQETQAEETPAEETPTDGGEAQPLTIVATEYQFEGMPDTLAAGKYELRLQNDGKEPHEFAVAQVLTDTPVDKLLTMPQDQVMKEIKPAGATFAPPGKASEQPFIAEFTPGRYVAVCFVPLKGKEGNPPHASKGMVHEFTVE